MGKILVLGNNPDCNWIASLSDNVFLQIPSLSLGEEGEKRMCRFILSNISEDIDVCVIDVDSITNPELCLVFAMALRLSIFDLHKASSMPLLFVTDATPDIFYGFKYSCIILTGSVYCETPENVEAALGVVKPLSAAGYKSHFLDIVKVLPSATEGRHSLANQWGADVLSRMVSGTITDNSRMQEARQSLYFKYVLALTLNPEIIQKLYNNEYTTVSSAQIEPINALGKKILLIDDEADKGWSTVLKQMLKGANVKTFCEQVPDYVSLSEEARHEIESEDYDIIFLDLRLNGIKEEDSKSPNEFSGMKILKKIKKLNKGTQVIMLTASNKAWNMKALLDEGADGYYIKESPEYAFSPKYSLNNAQSFRTGITKCFERSYLRKVAHDVKQFKKALAACDYEIDFVNRISAQLDVAYTLVSTARTQQQFAFAYISLEQIIEIISEELIYSEDYHFYIDENGEECLDWVILNGHSSSRTNYNWKDYPQWKKMCSLYYQLWKGKDSTFGEEIRFLIGKRNAFMHNDKAKLKETDINNKRIDIYSKDGFIRLFDMISKILNCAI